MEDQKSQKKNIKESHDDLLEIKEFLKKKKLQNEVLKKLIDKPESNKMNIKNIEL